MLVEAKCSLEALNLSKETRYRGLQRSFLSTLQIFFSFISNMWYLNSAENTSESFLLRQFMASCTLLLLFFFTYYHNIGLLFSYFLFYFELTNWILFFVCLPAHFPMRETGVPSKVLSMQSLFPLNPCQTVAYSCLIKLSQHS